MPASHDRKRSKTDILAEDGMLKSGPGEGPRSEVSGRRILRSVRCRAGQVRDVAPRLGREGVGDRCVRRLRGLAANLLPGQGGFRGRGHCRACAQKARPPRAPQNPGRGVGIPPSAGLSRPTDTGARSWRGWSRRNSVSISIQERSNGRSVQKKHRYDRDRRQPAYPSDCHCRSIREAALGHAW